MNKLICEPFPEMKIRKGLFTENNVEKQRKKKYSKNKSIV